MLTKYETLPVILFSSIDARLCEYGVEVRIEGASVELVGSVGTLRVKSEVGVAVFERGLGVDARDILEAIELAYAVTVVRTAADAAKYRSVGHGLSPNPVPIPSWILLEGPPVDGIGTSDVFKWVEAVQVLDKAMSEHAAAQMKPLAPCALALLRRWRNESGVFGVNVSVSPHADAIALMVRIGLLERTGLHYQIVVPRLENMREWMFTVQNDPIALKYRYHAVQEIADVMEECDPDLWKRFDPLMRHSEIEALKSCLRDERALKLGQSDQAAKLWRQCQLESPQYSKEVKELAAPFADRPAVVQRLHTEIKRWLFGDSRWPDRLNKHVLKQLEQMNLAVIDLDRCEISKVTELGEACDTELAMCFAGVRDDVTILKALTDAELITEEDEGLVKALNSLENDWHGRVDILKKIAQRAYPRWRQSIERRSHNAATGQIALMATKVGERNVARIQERLDRMVDYYLFEAPTWPPEDDDAAMVYQAFEEMGLGGPRANMDDIPEYTAFGAKCGARLSACFIGVHDLVDIPVVLAEAGLIDQSEVDAFEELEGAPTEVWAARTEALVHRAYRRMRRRKAA